MPRNSHHVYQPPALLCLRSWSAAGEESAIIREVLGLDKELAESRVSLVGGLPGKGNLRVAGQLQLVSPVAPVGKGHTPYLGIIFGANHYLHMRFYISVAPEELSLVQSEGCPVTCRWRSQWRGSGGP